MDAKRVMLSQKNRKIVLFSAGIKWVVGLFRSLGRVKQEILGARRRGAYHGSPRVFGAQFYQMYGEFHLHFSELSGTGFEINLSFAAIFRLLRWK